MKLELSDFKKGQKAYILERNIGYNRPAEIIETTVTSVGRKYVYTSYFERKYKNGEHYKGLFENVGFGTPSELYATREQAEEEIERDKLVRSINKHLHVLYRCTIEELREMNSLLCKRGGLERRSMNDGIRND